MAKPGVVKSASLSIGDVAREAGIRTSAIRFYESEKLLPLADRVNGRRRYEASVFERLALIELCQQAGFTIGDIRTLLHGFGRRTPPPVRWHALAGRKLEEMEERIRRARAMKRVLEQLLRCECPTLADCAPGRGAKPGCGRTQPGFGRTKPGFGRTQPGYGRTQPGRGPTQPGRGRTRP